MSLSDLMSPIILNDAPTKKEEEESRKDFVKSLKLSVAAGGNVVLNGSQLEFKVKGKNLSYCISKQDAIEYCGFKC